MFVGWLVGWVVGWLVFARLALSSGGSDFDSFSLYSQHMTYLHGWTEQSPCIRDQYTGVKKIAVIPALAEVGL